MKKFPYVPDQTLLEADGNAAKKPDGSEPVWTHFSFLCARVADQAFGGARPGLEALRFAMATQIALSEQRETANNRGFWILEDEYADALLRVTRNPSAPYNTQYLLTLMVFAEATEKMEPYKAEAA